MVWQFSYKCMAICISKLPIYMPNYIVYRPFFTLVLLPAEKYQCGKVPYGTFPHWYFFRKTHTTICSINIPGNGSQIILANMN